MATLTITEFRGLAVNARSGLSEIAPLDKIVAEQTKAITAASAQTAALNAATRLIRVYSDVACRISLGADPIATGVSVPFSAGMVEYFHIEPAADWKLAVIGGA